MIRDKPGEQDLEVHHQGKGPGKQQTWKETGNKGQKGKPSGRRAHCDRQACTITHEGLSKGGLDVETGFMKESQRVPQQSVDLRRAPEGDRSNPKQQVSHGSVFRQLPDRGDSDQWDEGTLPVHQGRVPTGTGTPWNQTPLGLDSTRVEGAAARGEAQDGLDSGSQDQFHHGRDQEGNQERASEHVCGSGDSLRQQGDSGRTTPGTSSVVGELRDSRDGDHFRSSSRSNLWRAGSDGPIVSGLGKEGGAGGDRTRVEVATAGQVGSTGGSAARDVAGGEAICSTRGGTRDQAEHEPRDSGQSVPQLSRSASQNSRHCGSQRKCFASSRHGEDAYTDGEHVQGDPRPQAGEQGADGREGSEDHNTHREQLRSGGRDGIPEDGGTGGHGPIESLSQSDSNLIYQEPACEQGHLSERQCSLLRNASQDCLPNAWNAVVNQGRLFLLEVACSPESTLTAEALSQGLPAKRASIHNGCDLTTPEGLRNTLELVREGRPQHVWISTECGPYSPMQNCNQRSEQQILDLEKKRRDARKQYLGGLVVAYFARSEGSEVHWEWSRRCRAWRWKNFEHFREHMGTFTAIVGGCRVDLFVPNTRKFIQKEWRVETTSEDFSRYLHLPCLRDACQGEHTPCEGRLTRMSAFYPLKMAKRIIRCLRLLTTKEMVQDCLKPGKEGTPQKPQTGPFLGGDHCNCRLFRDQGLIQLCPNCILRSHKGEVFVGDDQEEEPLTQQEKNEWFRKFRLIHSATGHGSLDHLTRVLVEKGVPQKVVDLSKEFKCDVCEERKRPLPRRVATLEVVPKKWKVMLADCAVWRHPHTQRRTIIGLFMDQGSRFVVGKVLTEGETKNVNSDQYVKFFQENWQPYFGAPDYVRFDGEGTWRSRQIDDMFSKLNVMLDPIPGDAHWHIAPLERAIGWIKETLSRLSLEDQGRNTSEVVAQAIAVWNQREMVRGFSPYQHALGQAPDLDGKFFDSEIQGLPIGLMDSPVGEFRRQSELRLRAEEIFIRWQASERLSRALNSKGRPVPVYNPGDLVFYWRQIKPGGQGQKHQTGSYGGYAGPARVLAMEVRYDEAGNPRNSSVIWLVRNNRILKATVQQLRLASKRETVMHELSGVSEEHWDVGKLVAPLANQTFDDITGEAKDMPSPEDREGAPRWRSDLEWEAPTKRARVKTPGTRKRVFEDCQDGDVDIFPDEEHKDECEPSGHRDPQRERLPQGSREHFRMVDEARESHVRERSPRIPRRKKRDDEGLFAFLGETETAFWQEEGAAVTLEIELPNSRHGWMHMAKDPKAYIGNMLKRKTAEVSEKYLNDEERDKFSKAKDVEMTKFLQADALEALPPRLQPSRGEAMSMRWLLTWKVNGEGETVAKARIVILGYQDPNYENRVTYAPTTTRHTRQTMLQVAAGQQWGAWKGDVAAAFLQGRECTEDMFCVPTRELCEKMGIPRESVVRLRKSCYGLVQAPYEWYETVRTFLLSIGFRQANSDPCCWLLVVNGETKVIVSGHVDDFMFVAQTGETNWETAKQRIQEKFRWGEFEVDSFTQCGVQITRQDDGGFILSQERYMQHVKEISLSKERRSQRKEETTPWEKTALRGLLGALSWHCSQIGFRFSAYVSLSLSEVPTSTVGHLIQTNGLLQKVKDASREPMRIFPIPCQDVVLYAWSDASNQNRLNGASTKGIFIGAASKGLLQGEVARVSPMFWQSGKIERVCRAPGASEAHAAIDAEDVLWLLRYQWFELSGGIPDMHNPDEAVSKTKGVLITDSRSIFDKLQRPYISPTGQSKKIDIELLILKQSQEKTGLIIRWVNSEAMLANSLTKRGEDTQMNKYIACKQTWRIVDDPEMFSGRKLKQQGRDLLNLQQTGGEE